MNTSTCINSVFRTPLKAIGLLLLLSQFSCQSWALNRSFSFEHFNEKDGLTSQVVVSATQDIYGFVWFGTEDIGVFRYDGHKFEHFKHDHNDSYSISAGPVYSILADKDGSVWFAIAGGGISQYDPHTNRFSTIKHQAGSTDGLLNNYVYSLLKDNQGQLWIGTETGISVYDPSRKTFKNIKVQDGQLSGRGIWHMMQDSKGLVWIATYGNGLNVYDPKMQTFEYFRHDPTNSNSLAHDVVGAILEDQDGTIWVGGKGGLNRFDAITKHFKRYQHDENDEKSLLENYVWDMHLDKRGFIWLGGYGGGLARFYPETGQVLRHSHDTNRNRSISGNLVWFVFEDRSGVLWVGVSDGALNKYVLANDQFTSYLSNLNDKNSLPIEKPVSIYQARDGLIWIGAKHPKGGLVAWDKSNNHIKRYISDDNDPNGIPNGAIFTIAEDQESMLWFGGGPSGLSKLNPKTGKLTRFRHDPNDENSLSHDVIRKVVVDHENNIWACGLNGLSKLNTARNKFTHYFKGQRCNSVLMDSKYNLWVASELSGVHVFKAGKDKPIQVLHGERVKGGLSGNHVTVFFETSENHLWLGTEGGGIRLWQEDSETFIGFDESDGLANNSVSWIHEDNLKRLWIATSSGLSLFELEKKHFTNFYVEDGLPSNKFTRFSGNAGIKDKKGQFLLVASVGIVEFDPNKITGNQSIPTLVFNNLQVNYQSANLSQSPLITKRLEMDWQDRVVSFSYSVLEFVNPKKNYVEYKLEGFDENWINAQGKYQVTYTNLDGGDYAFKVRASNNHGVWNEQPLMLDLQVNPPWWNTLYARVMYILLVLLVIWLSVYYRTRVKEIELREQAQRSRQLEQQVKERTEHLHKAIADLNAHQELLVQAEKTIAMGRLVTGVAHEINTPLGVCITAMSALKEIVNTIKTMLHENKLSKKDFDDNFSSLIELTDLSNVNLSRAGEIVRRFKKISVDQVQETLTVFLVKEVIDNVVTSINSEFYKRSVSWDIHCSKDLKIKSYANSVYTIVDNICSNVFVHAYKSSETCHIYISVEYEQPESRLMITIKDQGLGIPDKEVPYIFDPFYTTARGDNCMGLGLHIAYIEASQRLGGSIKCHSKVNEGTTFFISFNSSLQTST